MKYRFFLLFPAILVLSIVSTAQDSKGARPPVEKPAAVSKAPTVKEVLDRYVTALGGREAIEKLKARAATGTVEIMPMNLKGTFETYAAPDAKSFIKMSFAGIGDFFETSDGKSAWSLNPIQGSREKTGAELAQAKLVNDFYRDIRLESLYPKIVMKGIEKVGGNDAYALTATTDGGQSETWYFDIKSGLMVRSDMTVLSPEGRQQMSNYPEDLRAVDGVLIPHRTRTEGAGMTIVVNLTAIKHGEPIDEAKFGKPKQ